MPITVKESKGGKLKIAGADNNTPAQRKELERLAQLELRKVGTDKRDEWFEEKYKGEKVAGPDAFKSAMGHDWGEEAPDAPEGSSMESFNSELDSLGIKRVRVYSPKDLKDLERKRGPVQLNFDDMAPELREWIAGEGQDDSQIKGLGLANPLKDRNRATVRGFDIERHSQFDVRGWRFDASQHYGGQTTENLPWARKLEDWQDPDQASWNKYIRPYLLDDGKELGLMWINPRMPKDLTAKKVIDDFVREGGFKNWVNDFGPKLNEYSQRDDTAIGESTRLAKEANRKEGAAYRKEYAEAREDEVKGGTVPSAGLPDGSLRPLSPAMKAKKTIRIRSAEEEERKLMEEPLKKGKK